MGGVLGVSLFWVWVSLFWVCVQLYGLGVWFCLSCWMVWSICWRALRIASWNSFVFIGVVVRRFASWLCRCSRRMRFLVLLGLFRRGRGFRRVWRLWRFVRVLLFVFFVGLFVGILVGSWWGG